MNQKPFWRRLFHNPLGLFGVVVIGLVSVFAVLGYLITPDSSKDANTMHLSLINQPPGTTFTRLVEIKSPGQGWLNTWLFGAETSAEIVVDSVYETKDQWMVRTAHSSFVAYPKEQYSKEDFTFLLGSDKFGRDLLSRLILGSRVSISVGFISVFISLLLGIPLGLIAGYYRGWVDRVIMWLVQVIWSVPTLLMVIALTFVLGKGFWQVFVAVGLTMWVEVARIVRGQVLSIREAEYIDAARVLGFGDIRILLKHILPNIWAPVIVISAANFGSAILMESGLSFLGIGAQPPISSWGGMIKDHYPYLLTGKAYLALIPGFCIMMMVLAFMLLGNALRDILDVKNT